MFSGGMEIEPWPEMGQTESSITLCHNARGILKV